MDRGEKCYTEYFTDTNEQQEDVCDGKNTHSFSPPKNTRRKLINLINEKKLGISIKYYVYYDTEVLMYGCNRVKFGDTVININMDKNRELFWILEIAAQMIYCHLHGLDFETTPLSFYYKD